MYYRPEQEQRVASCKVYSYDAYSEKTRAFRHHNHDVLELLTIRQGCLRVTLDGREYFARAGDTVIINPYCIHFGEWRADESGEYICILLNLNRVLCNTGDIIQSTKNDLLHGIGRFDELSSDAELYSLILKINEDFHTSSASGECRLSAELFGLLELLFERYYHHAESVNSLPRDIDFMKRVTVYIAENYTENISTSDIAGIFYMSVQNFCYIFRRYFGKSFRNALCEYRLAKAVDIYTEQKMPFSQLAERVGFLDYCYFSRAFRKQYGQSPAVYFEKRKKTSTKK